MDLDEKDCYNGSLFQEGTSEEENIHLHEVDKPDEPLDIYMSQPENIHLHEVDKPDEALDSYMSQPQNIHLHEVDKPDEALDSYMSQPEKIHLHEVDKADEALDSYMSQPENIHLHEMDKPDEASDSNMNQPENIHLHEVDKPDEASDSYMNQPENIHLHEVDKPDEALDSYMSQPEKNHLHEVDKADEALDSYMSQPENIHLHEMDKPDEASDSNMNQPENIHLHEVDKPDEASDSYMNQPENIHLHEVDKADEALDSYMSQPENIHLHEVDKLDEALDSYMSQPENIHLHEVDKADEALDSYMSQPENIHLHEVDKLDEALDSYMSQPENIHLHEVDKPDEASDSNMSKSENIHLHELDKLDEASDSYMNQPDNIHVHEVDKPDEASDSYTSQSENIHLHEVDKPDVASDSCTSQSENIHLHEVDKPDEALDSYMSQPENIHLHEVDKPDEASDSYTSQSENIHLHEVGKPDEALDSYMSQPENIHVHEVDKPDEASDSYMSQPETIHVHEVDKPDEASDSYMSQPENIHLHEVDKPDEAPDSYTSQPENIHIHEVDKPDEASDSYMSQPENIHVHEVDKPDEASDSYMSQPENIHVHEVDKPDEASDSYMSQPENIHVHEVDKPDEASDSYMSQLETIHVHEVDKPDEASDSYMSQPENIHLHEVDKPDEASDSYMSQPENIHLHEVDKPDEASDNYMSQPENIHVHEVDKPDEASDSYMSQPENIHVHEVDKPDEASDSYMSQPENIHVHEVDKPDEASDSYMSQPETIHVHEVDKPDEASDSYMSQPENIHLHEVDKPDEASDSYMSQPENIHLHEVDKPDEASDSYMSQPENIHVHEVDKPDEASDNYMSQPENIHVHEVDKSDEASDSYTSQPENIHVHEVDKPDEASESYMSQPENIHLHEVDKPDEASDSYKSQSENIHLHEVDKPDEASDIYMSQSENIHLHEVDEPDEASDSYMSQPENIHLHEVDKPDEASDSYKSQPENIHVHEVDKPDEASDSYMSQPENIHLHEVDKPDEASDSYTSQLENINIHLHEVDKPDEASDSYMSQSENIHLYEVDEPDEALDSYMSQSENIHLHEVDEPDEALDSYTSQSENIHLYEVDEPDEAMDNPINATIPVWEPLQQELMKHLEEMMPDISQILHPEHFWESKIKTIDEKLKELKMEKFRTSKLSLMEVLEIGQEDLKKIVPQRVEDIPWCFLRNLMALNGSARNTRFDQSFDTRTIALQDEDIDFMDDMSNSDSIHPLDVLCVLLHCSDSFLQQEIVTKMSMCQFSLPLLLPASDGPDCTFMLWAMRDIVKRWRPQSLANSKGCREDNLVNIPMPVFSFVRLGKCHLSKSRILNYILSSAQQHHDFFVHQNMEGANISREVSDGLVEIAWFFPGGRENLDLFPDPIAVTNLRGELESNLSQLSFLTKVSTAILIFIEDIDEKQYSLLSNIEETNTNYFLVIAPLSRCISEETQKYIKMLYPVLKINRKNVLVKTSTVNDAELVKKLQVNIADLMKSSPYYITLEEMSHIAGDLGILVDESSEEHQNTRKLTLDISKSVKDVVQYKNETMRLQGNLWKQLARTEKEICRMKGQGNENAEDYKTKLVKKCSDLRKQQSEVNFPDGIVSFITAITNLPQVEKHYFLKWLKLYLDSISRNHLCALQMEYKEHCYNMTTNVDKLKQLDQKISNSSLGVEHFIREIGQFYEAECFMAKDCIYVEKELFQLPGIAADLLLDGLPLELIDGDASNIPLQWITDVLTELDTKTGGQCRMRVITVLGVQSTGKSTLLNTMFGLQFPVASGRCTRGAFMTLIRVKENFQEELGCEFILVIDTEGLKAPELAFLEDSYEHDNELATLVVGLSDITIVNMAMENTAEIKDILQIVVHAFLRMKEIGKKPNCQFVHQNVSDVSAHDKNMRDRKKLLEQLDEMTKVASRMEEKDNITKFSDVMEYHFEEHSWYIPGLWHGVPPMASVNTGYSQNIFELKIHLFEIMKKQLESRRPQNISDFIKWVKSLWNAVKYENFIFSFRNSLVAEAYNQLSIKYSELEWNFRKMMHKWMIETENEILNQSASELEAEMWSGIKGDMHRALQEEERIMLEALEEYFESGNRYVHLVERYREDFLRSVTTLRNEIEDNLGIKCEEASRIHRGKQEIHFVQNSYIKTIEGKATSLLDSCRNLQHQMSDGELESEFEAMWNKTMSGLQFSSLKKHNISQEMVEQLRKDMRHKAGYINEKLNNVKSLDDYGQNGLNLDKKYVQSSWYDRMPEAIHRQYWKKLNDLVTSLKDQFSRHVTEQVNTMKDYHQNYCQELLNIINERLNQDDVRNLHLTPLFELDLKLHLLGRVAPVFQKKHNIFFQENNMKFYLDKLKPQYFSMFTNVYHEKDESKVRAQRFCEVCVKPALSDYVYKNLGGEIVNDILTSGDSMRYSSRTFFQYTLLKELLEDYVFNQYVKYNNHYETFVKNWIIKYITDKYKESTSLESLKSNILVFISRKVREVLKDPKVRESSNVSQCLKTFCAMLKKDLVIAQNEMKVIMFQNNANPGQFSADIEAFLDDIEKQIITEIKHFNIEYVLSKVTLKPQDELFKKVFGCGKQCPFCKVPCEAGAAYHKEHFASVHRPQGLGEYRCTESKVLSHSICSTDVVGTTTFLNSDTEWKPHLYKGYRKIYPDWVIQPDTSISASDYWKFVFKEFNKEFSGYYNAKPANIPEDWDHITKEQALQSLQQSFNMK